MGSPKAEAYLASPAVVAASALNGFISSPGSSTSSSTQTPVGSLREVPVPPRGPTSVVINPGFPTRLSGGLVFCNQDNINTDGIYPGKYTYNENMSPEQMAAVVMENYDTQFLSVAKKARNIFSTFYHLKI